MFVPFTIQKVSNPSLFVIKQKISNVYFTIKDVDEKSMVVAFTDKKRCQNFHTLMRDARCVPDGDATRDTNLDTYVTLVPYRYLSSCGPQHQLKVLIYDKDMNSQIIDVCNDCDQIRFMLENHHTYQY